MKTRVTQNFNKQAATYDAAAMVQTRVAQRLIEKMNINSQPSILEIGCGTGIFSHLLLEQFPTSNLLLTDIAPAMLSRCRTRFGNFPQIQYACMDGESIEHLSTTHDLIVSNMTMQWFTDIYNSFLKIIEKLKPQGNFVFTLLGKNSLFEWQEICKQHHISPGMPPFPEAGSLQKNFPHLQLEVETLQQTYPNSYAFLKSLKNLGAITPSTHYQPMSHVKLRNLLQQYNDEMTISYEVIFGSYKKS